MADPNEPAPPSGSVANILVGKPDGRGEIVQYVFFKRTDYTIYQCNNKIVVCYSDDPVRASK
jgi:hypothetical protein